MSKETIKRIALVLVRGRIDLNQKMLSTLDMLKLFRKNYCVVVNDTPANRGMAKKVKDYTTFGNIDDETYKLLIEKRGKEYTDRTSDKKNIIKYEGKFFVYGGKNYRSYFRLNAPKKGFGRKGIKVQFLIGGALGDRKEKINDLIRRMI
ncbi:uL30 family ribosomal protein [Candidatus Woesearchaeota archaeon]|nr:uL30 family ribosomal protein [Candidatus Woesearchaeota archaeon]